MRFSAKYMLFALSVLFFYFSKLIFDAVFQTSKVIVDEEFHIPLGLSYCRYDFENWDPKVTTPPGLYLMSALLMGPFGFCSIYALRFTSLLASVVNLYLFYLLLKRYNKVENVKNILLSINLALLPPLYFFSHLYYTDVLSLTTILLLLIFSENGNHYIASIFGMISLIFRQTNIIYIGMVWAKLIVNEVYKCTKKQHGKRTVIRQTDLYPFIKDLKNTWWIAIQRTSLQFWLDSISYITLMCSFTLFVYLNGSIVVGDKTAHQATVHFPQLFYFGLFSLIFAWPYFMEEAMNFVKFAKQMKLFIFICILLCAAIVYLNTQVHPYLLADNRHYIFYIWNRFYGKYAFFRYLMIPVYIFALSVIIKKVWDKNDVTFALLYFPCILLVLITQKLIEPRYFFVPYILFRLHTKTNSFNLLLLEFITSIFINGVTMYIFFNKEIYWHEYNEPQRIIW